EEVVSDTLKESGGVSQDHSRSQSTRRQSVKVQPKFETNDDCVTSVGQEYTISGVNTKHSGALRMVQSKLRPGERGGQMVEDLWLLAMVILPKCSGQPEGQGLSLNSQTLMWQR
ncbi:hypothetical protein B0H14DRAFT_2635750, partial [Mycena olivaceomarginata]